MANDTIRSLDLTKFVVGSSFIERLARKKWRLKCKYTMKRALLLNEINFIEYEIVKR